MVEPLIRLATTADAAELSWLESIAREQLIARRGGDLWLERHDAQTPEWAAAENGSVIVAVIDEVVVGYLRYELDGDVVHVHDVYVHPDAREVSCGDELLAAAVDIGRRNGVKRIEAEALPGDRETKNLYERAGITAKRITVSSFLDDLP